MKLVFFGLTITSSWGNGHATLLRGLFKALVRGGHQIVFFERDVPYYASHRDLLELPGVELQLYDNWSDIASKANAALADADVGIVTSYCPDGILASNAVLNSNLALTVFYDLDTPVTLEAHRNGQKLSYIGPRGLSDFDLVLSYTGGAAINQLKEQLGARLVLPLFGSVDPDVHQQVRSSPRFEADLSYLGTYAEDRQNTLEELFIEPARKLPGRRFILGGSKYPNEFPWLNNIWYVQHVSPVQHASFYCSSPLTLNVTRYAMARMGYCPSGRLFEAAACGTAIISDNWVGLDTFFDPGSEIIVVSRADEVVQAMSWSPSELKRIADAGRERVLEKHTAKHRALELENALNWAFSMPALENRSSPNLIAAEA